VILIPLFILLILGIFAVIGMIVGPSDGGR